MKFISFSSDCFPVTIQLSEKERQSEVSQRINELTREGTDLQEAVRIANSEIISQEEQLEETIRRKRDELQLFLLEKRVGNQKVAMEELTQSIELEQQLQKQKKELELQKRVLEDNLRIYGDTSAELDDIIKKTQTVRQETEGFWERAFRGFQQDVLGRDFESPASSITNNAANTYNIQIEQVNGVDPEEISQALAERLSTEIRQ